MASSDAFAPFYRGRVETRSVDAQHVARNLERYLGALERMARAAEEASAGDAARVYELLAAVRRAQALADEAPEAVAENARTRIARVQAEANALAEVRVRVPLRLTQAAPQRRTITGPEDEYWDDCLFAGLTETSTKSAPANPTDIELEAEYGQGTEAAVHEPAVGGDSTPNQPSAPAPDALPKEGSSALQSDRSMQDALSSELLRMASVLKKNSSAFTDALERDRVRVEQAGTRLGQNLDLMTRTRGQLGVFSKKVRSMGWFTLGSIAAVLASWLVMFVVIRLT